MYCANSSSKEGILLSIDAFVISPCLANKWFIKDGTAVSGLHTYYWVWSGPKLQLTVLEELLGDARMHHTGKQRMERWSFFYRQHFFSLIKFLGFIFSHISRRRHGWLCSESSLLSSEGKATEACSPPTGGGALWRERRCAARYPVAVSPASFPVKMHATESYHRERANYFEISGGEITLYFSGHLLPSERLTRNIYQIISSMYLILFRKKWWKTLIEFPLHMA